jgi:pyruvate kinase
MPRTKIVCTIGPASRSAERLEQLVRAGMDVARLNFSHGTQAEHLEVIHALRRIAHDLGRPVAILQDLAGLKIRIGAIAGGSLTLEAGAPLSLTTRPILGSSREIAVGYPHLTQDVQPGDTLLLSDGEIELEVLAVDADVQCRVITGGTLTSRKGLNLPGRSITAPTFTDKDRDDLAFGLRHAVDWVALSFVRTADDVRNVRSMIRDHGSTAGLVAKIETQLALTNIEEIVAWVDGVMVARGDLGVAIPLATVPRVQKTVIRRVNRAGIPVITATHMLRSMQDSPRPTRAEATDVANAVLDGSDALMLSEETAIGRFPRQAVMTMAAIATDAESCFPSATWMDRFETGGPLPETVARAACTMAAETRAAAIVACTESGTTARRVSQYRPAVPILAATPRAETYRRLALVWGVTPLLTQPRPTTDAVIDAALGAALAVARLQRGDTVVIVAGVPAGQPGSTNLIKVATV